MSVTVFFPTEMEINPELIFDRFMHLGHKIMVTSDTFPFLKFGEINEGLRGVEINREEEGYEVRVCSFANHSDLKFFRETVKIMDNITSERGLYEYDEDEIIDEPEEFFDREWVNNEIESYIRVAATIIKSYGNPIVLDGLFMPICIGPRLLERFHINLSNPDIKNFILLQKHLSTVQWNYGPKKNTSTRLALRNPDNEEDLLSVTPIVVRKGRVESNKFISFAEIVSFIDEDKDEVVNIPIYDLHKIVFNHEFVMLDEYQMAFHKRLTYNQFISLKNRATFFCPENIFIKPLFPGNGFQDEFNTFVLMWNPGISSVRLENHNSEIPKILTSYFNWSVKDYKLAKKGDKFIMIRCGEGRTGLVMSGIFDSYPYQGEDWSGRGRQVFYMDLRPNFIADPDKLEDLLTTEDLQELIPSFDWRGGASGRLLTMEQALKLEIILTQYLSQFHNNVDGVTVNGFDLPASSEEP